MNESDPLLISSVNNNTTSNKVETIILGGNGKIIGSSLNLACSAIGVGILSLPFTVRNLGILFGVLAFIFVAIITYVSLYYLVESAVLSNTRSYQDAALVSYGLWCNLLIALVICIGQWGACVGSVVIIGDVFTPAMELILPHVDFLHDRNIVVLFSLIIILPLSLPREFNTLRFGSSIAVFSHIYIVLLVVVNSMIFLFSSERHSLPPIINDSFSLRIIQSIPIIVFAFGCSIQVIPVFDELKDRRLKTMKKVIVNGVSLSFGCYTLVGVFGFLEFQYNTNSNVLTNYPTTSIPVTIGRILLGIAVCLGFPLLIWPLKNTTELLFFYARDHKVRTERIVVPVLVNIIETILLVGSSVIVGILIPSISFIFGLIGSTTATLSCFIIPTLMFLKLTSKQPLRSTRKVDRVVCCFILFFGVVIGVLGTTATIILQS
eukprot:TRINITY_DN2072_c0_g1_i1.p1 TRINITY_DN2072_c0_g1~~TRINITY_DN2072_c0_g1_i1.p1  ORF type:complete len:434 (-),score=36.14 TRINITY_DN2072_c0_g1_i1:68-1369(-)